MSAEGARSGSTESLRPKDRAGKARCICAVVLSGVAESTAALFYFVGRKYNASPGSDDQCVSIRLHSYHSSGRDGAVLHLQDPLRTGTVLQGRLEGGLWKRQASRRQAVERPELLPGAGHGGRGAGRHRQHRRRLRRDPGRRPRSISRRSWHRRPARSTRTGRSTAARSITSSAPSPTASAASSPASSPWRPSSPSALWEAWCSPTPSERP